MKLSGKVNLVLAAVVYVILLNGCGTEFISIKEDMYAQQMKGEARPNEYSALLGPVKINYDREYFNRERAAEENAWMPEWDVEAQYNGLASLFTDFGIFSTLNRVPNPHASNMAEVLQQAYNTKSDFVLQLQVDKYQVSFAGFAGNYIPNMLGWFLFTPTSWLVHDELFRTEIEMTLNLIDIYSRRAFFTQTFQSSYQMAFNDFGRGWKLFGIFRTPGCLEVQNWEKINSQLASFALKNIKLDILESMIRGKFNRELTNKKEVISKQVVVCAGVSNYNDRKIPSTKYAASDAELLHSVLTDPEDGMGINPLFCRLFKDKQVAKEDVIATVKDLCSRCSKQDTFLFYFSGFGYTSRDTGGSTEGYLIPADCDFDRVSATAISMADLEQCFSNIKARNIILILDCSFYSSPSRRSLPGTSMSGTYSFFNKLTSDPRVRIIVSSSAGEPAYEFASLKQGLFTYYLCSGVTEKKADSNMDGKILLEEAYQFTKNNVYEISGYRGNRQRPVTLGKGSFEFLMYTDEKKEPVFDISDGPAPALPESEVDEKPSEVPEEDKYVDDLFEE